MRIIADLHIHSKYSMATSRELDPQHLDLWARYKGIQLLGTGDFTHPAWREALSSALEPAEEGLYRLKADPLEAAVAGEPLTPRFVVSGEISCIYKQGGKTRKVHNLILLPSLEAAEELSRRLEAIGNIRSDGRPILGLSSRDLLEVTLEACPEAVFIPAHIWTPHFSMLGAFSAFSSVQDCFLDLSGHIHALETGLSSDPSMNFRVSALDGYQLVSHSDAHSPSKLGREANLLDVELSYPALKAALDDGAGLLGTLEFFPEEGKYHLDGHRGCRVCLEPGETEALGGRCPVCGRKLTVGVQHRVEALADRPSGFRPANARSYERLAPLPELLAGCLELPAGSKAVDRAYFSLLRALGPEFYILREAPLPTVEAQAGPAVAEGLRRLREGRVLLRPGFDGQFGAVSLFQPGELAALRGQTSLALGKLPQQAPSAAVAPAPPPAFTAEDGAQPATQAELGPALNEDQRRAAFHAGPALAVVAGPGTGKTGTLVARIAHLLQEGAKPSTITAITFTNQAAAELRQRLERFFGGKRALKGLNVGTFHALCLHLLLPKSLLGQAQALRLLRSLPGVDAKEAPALQQKISAVKNGLSLEAAGLQAGLLDAYQTQLEALHARDLDDVLLEALALDLRGDARFTHLLVDEYQDINALQRNLVLHFAQAARSLFVIGDPDQSIYGFRGASARCFDELARERPDLARVELRRNYRSSPQILRAALHLISHNPGGERALLPCAKDGPAVRLVQTDSPFAEGAFIARSIAAMAGGMDMLQAQRLGSREGARSFQDMAVLCRTRRQLERIEASLVRESIPCVVLGREAYWEDEAVQGALGFFRWLLNPRDQASLRDALALAYGCAPETADGLARLCAGAEDPSPGALLARLGPLGEAAALLSEAEAFLPRLRKEKPAKLLEAWAQTHGGGEPMGRLQAAALFHKTLPDLLEALLLGGESDLRRAGGGKRVSSGAVRLLTLHASKGLEFPAVFLAGLEKGQLPLEREGDSPDLEEERRLLFVGFTRAKEELILSFSGEPSPFVAELGPEVHFERDRRRAPQPKQLSLF